ncbi:MAG: hypothetical protein GXX09_07690 [Syntrophomonadaceae bacterium]|nr:hypothetical protein [Syntrophomonadaceae bacterium]
MRGWTSKAVYMVLMALVASSVLWVQQTFYDSDIASYEEVALGKYGYRERQPLTPWEKRKLTRALEWARRIPVNTRRLSCEYVIYYKNRQGKSRVIFVSRMRCTGWNGPGRAFALNPALCRLLDNPIINLENRIAWRYGELIPWSQARSILGMFDIALVTDVNTGKSFWVQRRGGTNHADVQPLTARDSRIMKSIYQGKWSWERRAIIVACRNRRVAASMNGMPHGAGAIGDNDFDGHFCIHFYGSKTHRGNRVDERHQNMVLEAAGRERQRGKADD